MAIHKDAMRERKRQELREIRRSQTRSKSFRRTNTSSALTAPDPASKLPTRAIGRLGEVLVAILW